jgi:hypothetical protein
LNRAEILSGSKFDLKVEFPGAPPASSISLAAEGRWLALAHSYELQHRLSRTVAELDRRRKAGAITRMLREQGVAFGPDEVTRLTIAYHAVLHQLGLVDHENGAALIVAKRIVDHVARRARSRALGRDDSRDAWQLAHRDRHK